MKKSLFILIVSFAAFVGKTMAVPKKTATISSTIAINWSVLTWTDDVTGFTTGQPSSGEEATIFFATGSTSGNLIINVPINVAKLTITNNNLTQVILRSSVAQVKTNFPINVNGDFTIGGNIDFTLGTLGSTNCGVTCAGILNVKGSNTARPYNSGGLYCNANTISGAGSFVMEDFSFLGIGSIDGIGDGAGSGNIQMSATFATTGNYIYNGVAANQPTYYLPTTVNDLTTDNPLGVTLDQDRTINGINTLKQHVFDIGNWRVTYNGLGRIDNASTGKMKADMGTLIMKGTELSMPQYLNSAWFVDSKVGTLVDANTTGISIVPSAVGQPNPPGTPLIIVNSLEYGTDAVGEVDINGSTIWTNDNLTLQSNASGTANFGKISSSLNGTINAISGKVSIERYLTGQRAWRFLATPIVIGASSPTVRESWQEGGLSSSPIPGEPTGTPGYGTQITGPAGYTGIDQVSIGPSMKSPNTNFTGYDNVTNTITTSIANENGYMVFVRGDRTVSYVPPPPNTPPAIGSPATLRIKGGIRTGDQAFNVSAGFVRAFGNPYPSRFDFRTTTHIDIQHAYVAWTPFLPGLWNVGAYKTFYLEVDPATGLAGSYTTSDPNNPITGPEVKNEIESGQAIVVNSANTAISGINGRIIIHEADKTIGAGSNVSRIAPAYSAIIADRRFVAPSLKVRLFSNNLAGADPNSLDPTGKHFSSGLVVNFSSAFSQAIDEFDANKASNTYDNISVKDGKDNLQLLEADRRGVIKNLDTVFLNMGALRVADYRFDFTSTLATVYSPNVTMKLKDNFLNTLTPLSLAGNTSYLFSVTSNAQSKAADRFMIVFGTLNIAVEARNGRNTTIDADETVSITNTAVAPSSVATTKQKETLDKLASTKTAISISPNIVVNGEVNLRLENQPAGTYQLQIINQQGQVLKTASINMQTNNLLQTIDIGNAPAGSYQILITDKAGNKKTIGFLVN
jgi:hypothetical protein